MGRPAVIRHGRTQYKKGCRCDVCCKAEAVYRKTRRHGIESAVPDTSAEMGRNERAVREEIAGLSSAETRPGLVAGAISMAKVMDNQLAIAQHSQAMNRLTEALKELHQGGETRQGRLAKIEKMSIRAV
jgi:hypothetical protein